MGAYQVNKVRGKECRAGVYKEPNAIRFTAEFPYDKNCFVVLYDKKTGEICEKIPFPGKPLLGKLRSVSVSGIDWKNTVYNYMIEDEIFQDPYARALTKEGEFGQEKTSEPKCQFCFQKYSWEEVYPPHIPFEDAVMYHAHVRNFTMDQKSGVRHKGTFYGMQEKIPYLKELGINQILLMPAYEFDEMPKKEKVVPGKIQYQKPNENKNCWGYTRGVYFAPKASYAAGDDPVKEMKNMVKAFHKAGIEVLMEIYFTEEVTLRIQLECLEFWAQEYQIDGFRIMGNTPIARYLVNDPALCDVKLLCEYLGDYHRKEGDIRNCAEMNDAFKVDMRKFLKGDEGMAETIAWRTRRNPDDYAVINYLTSHDGFTLTDLVSYEQKHNEDNKEQNRDGADVNFSWNCGAEGATKKKSIVNLRAKQKRNAMLLMILSQGVPMIQAGDEVGNSQLGNNNPYCLDNEISWVNWNRGKADKEFLQFVKKTLKFRKNEPVFHKTKEMRMTDYKSVGFPEVSYHSDKAWYGCYELQSRQIGMLYCGAYSGTEDFIYVIYNMNFTEQKIALPKLPKDMTWYKVIDTGAMEPFQEKELEEVSKLIEIPQRTIYVLKGKKINQVKES